MFKFSAIVGFIVLHFLLDYRQKKEVDFESLNSSSGWNLQFSDACTEDWQNNWFKDGLISVVKQDETGMELIAGPVNRNDAHHTVLWTKQSFYGDIKIEYNYTITDTQIVNVNILYIQATGIKNVEKLFSWDSVENQFPEEGRIGLRHMFTHPVQCSDFKVWTR